MSSTLDRRTGGTILPMRLGFPLSPVIAIVLALGLAAPADAAPAHHQADHVRAADVRRPGHPPPDQAAPMPTAPRSSAGRWWSSAAESGTWSPIETVVTDDDGRAVVDATMFRRAADNVFRASYAGDAVDSSPTGPGRCPSPSCAAAAGSPSVGPTRWSTSSRCRVSVRWQTGNGLPVNGIVRLQRRNGGGDWRLVRKLRTGDGRPRPDHRAARGPTPAGAPRRAASTGSSATPAASTGSTTSHPASRSGCRRRRRAPGSTCPTSGTPSAPGRTPASGRSRQGSGTR